MNITVLWRDISKFNLLVAGICAYGLFNAWQADRWGWVAFQFACVFGNLWYSIPPYGRANLRGWFR